MNRLFLALSLTLLAACSFDVTGLSSRPPCDTDDDCESGVCVLGSCTPIAEVVPDAGDVGGADASDLPDGMICTPGESRCSGIHAERCSSDGSRYDRFDCRTEAECPGGGCTCVSGACVAATCIPGLRVCDGASVLECDATGSVVVVVETCSGGDVCLGGECIAPTCAAGETRCAGDIVVRCNDAGVPESESNCANVGAYCATGPVRCEPWVCQPGARRCDSRATGIERCDARGLGYGPEAECASDQICDNGQCVALSCEAGEQRCIGPALISTCDDTGTSVVVTECGGATYCASIDGGAVACLPQTCTPGDLRCADAGERVEVCDDRGAEYGAPRDCGPGEACRFGFCEAQACVPGDVQCVSDFRFATCNSSGESAATTQCEAGTYCDESGGTVRCTDQRCTPGERRCTDASAVEVCDSRGAGYSEPQACGGGTACEDAVCAAIVCTPGSVECLDVRTARVCNPSGTGWSESSCGGDSSCVAGSGCTPRVCAPGTLECDGDDIVTCSEDGTGFESVETCATGCVGGECAAASCGDSVVSTEAGEQCDDGNSNPCDGCDSCRFVRTGGIAAGTRTTSAVVWTPLQSDFTFEAWVNVTGGNGALFGLGERTLPDYVWIGVDTGNLSAEVALETGSVLQLRGGTRLTGAGWHHVAVQRYSTWGLVMYVDGHFDGASYTPFSQVSLDGTPQIWIGSEGTVTPVASSIDELRISTGRRYTREFAPSRRLATDDATVALYRLDESSGSTVADASPNGRDLTVTGLTRGTDTCFGAAANAITCGDGNRAPWEECDDGNTVNGDGCTGCRVDRCGSWVRGPLDHCFLLRAENRTWTSAREWCRDQGGDLAWINNAGENSWLTFFMGLTTNTWIGLNDRGREGNYVWSGGSSSSYRNWAPGEPNDGGGWTTTEDCVHTAPPASPNNAGRWNDLRCNDSLHYLCRRVP